MPRFSIVVPTYNGAAHISECLDSVLTQDERDLEVIVVDDESVDDTASVVGSIAARDERVKLIKRDKNGGTLRSRRAGVAATTGTWVLLVDQDDALAPGTLGRVSELLEKHDPDILHFGVSVVAENDAAQQAAAGMLGYLTPPARRLEGAEILERQFAEEDGFDWNVHHKVFRGSLARAAWGSLEDVRLTLSDDLYACFALCALATSYLAVGDAPWYVYHLGRGETFGSDISLADACSVSERDHRALELCRAFAQSGAVERSDWDDCLAEVRDRLIEHTMNEVRDKLSAELRPTALDAILESWGPAPVAAELMRYVRDDAYAVLASKAPFDGTEPFMRWFRKADELVASLSADELPAHFAKYRAAAFSHISDLERAAAPVTCDADDIRPVRSHDYERQRVKIFVTTHKDVALFDSNVLQPMQVGTARPRKRFLWALQDDTGDNISELNAMYCELTTQWWAWKNADADYYGFCHYRRYFDFSDEPHEENPYGEIMDTYVNGWSQSRYCLDDASIEKAVRGWDVITTGVNDVQLFPEHYSDLRDHYIRAPYLNVADLDRMVEILEELHPDYAEDAEAFLAGHTACFCNMFIMRKELFDRYCAWMFPVLERFCEGWDATHLGQQALRTPGHLSERLLNIFLLHEKRVNPELRHKELQCVHFEHPEPYVSPVLEPVVAEQGRAVVPIVLAADDAYVPMLTTTITSVLCNASSERCYDVVVFQRNITKRHQDEIASFVAGRWAYARVRFVDVAGLVHTYNLRTNNEHISVETYYRFLIQDVLPGYDKVLYLDSDLAVLGDVAELFDTELKDDLLGAVRDVDYLGNLNMPDGIRLAYSRDVLKLEDPYDYFQAGVLVLNVRAMRELHPAAEWLALAADSRYIYDDQDILNTECQGRVTYLDNAWNVMHDCGGRIDKVFAYAPADVFAAYRAAYANPRIVHYAGFEKPWKPGFCDLREVYWRYARQMPFYEELLASYAATPIPAYLKPAPHERAIGENSAARKVLDPLMPLGSRRREAAKAIVRVLRGRS